ncbi:hypothetical protein [Haloterrigena salinisoli]|uniref:hypothetical protein n=1 Tax=Haloterrigena salinisoli TaxID=3132747 RepID=UPI0030CA966C
MTNDRDRPTPPSDLDRDAREALARLEDRDADELRAIGEYLEALAAWTESTAGESEASTSAETSSTPGEHGSDTGSETDDASDDGDATDSDREYPPDVPERATVTVKEIAGTTYYYYQWRDGDRIESKTVQRE